MYKIEIDWKMRSPHLQVLTGEVRIDNIPFGLINPQTCKTFYVKKEYGSLEYRDCAAIFSRCKSAVDLMVRGYYEGMLLQDHSVAWFHNCHRKDNKVTIVFND